NPDFDQTYGAKWIVDASASFKPGDRWTLTVGADNLLDEYPDRTIAANANHNQFPYSSQSPTGFNGAYVYGRIAYTWRRRRGKPRSPGKRSAPGVAGNQS